MGLPDKTQVVTAKDGKPIVGELPLPKLRDDYVLVKVNAVGLNPTDWKHAAGGGGYEAAGLRIGCDYAGIVEEVGPKVNKKWQKGDRIAGFVHGA
jgi:NADPH:quinone reductase-like Zn-dependent oxidoreductase